MGTEAGRLLLAGNGAHLWVRAELRAEPGAWVLAGGTWDGVEVRGWAEVLATPHAPFPRPAGEWARLQEDGGRRAALLRSRAEVRRAVRAFFDLRGFLEVETPVMVPSPGLDVHLDAFEVAPGPPPRWLSTSPEYQMKRLLAGGLSRIYQIGKCFRRGEQGSRHEPEFTMVEWYRAFAGSPEVMADTEELVAHVAGALNGGSQRVRFAGHSIDVAPPWERLTVDEAFQRHAGESMWSVLPDEERFFRLLVDRVEPRLGVVKPTFLVGWPASMASLARLCPENPRLADRFEGYAGGMELCNGFGELVDPVEQRARLERDQARRRQLGKPVHPIDERFVQALEEGLPPCGGNALGLDRLVMLVLGVENVADVLAVPHRRL